MKSVGLPFLRYLTSRYYFYRYIFTFKWCCCHKPRGRIEKFKEDIINEFLIDKETKDSFIHYCLGKSEGEEKLKNIKENVNRLLKSSKKWQDFQKKANKKKGVDFISKKINDSRKKRALKEVLDIIIEAIRDRDEEERIETNEESKKKMIKRIVNTGEDTEIKNKIRMNQVHPFSENDLSAINLREMMSIKASGDLKKIEDSDIMPMLDKSHNSVRNFG